MELGQSLEVYQPGVADLGIVEGKRVEFGQSLEVFQPGVTDPGAPERKLLELGQSLEVFQPGVGNLLPREADLRHVREIVVAQELPQPSRPGWFGGWYRTALVIIRTPPAGLHDPVHRRPLFSRLFPLHRQPTERRGDRQHQHQQREDAELEPQPKEQGGQEPEEHQQQGRAQAGDRHQHGPALVRIEGEPAEPLRQDQKALQGQQGQHQAVRRTAEPAAAGFAFSSVGHAPSLKASIILSGSAAMARRIV